MTKVYEAIIRDHANFSNIVFRQFYDARGKADDAGAEALENFIAQAEPMYKRSYELDIFTHAVK